MNIHLLLLIAGIQVVSCEAVAIKKEKTVLQFVAYELMLYKTFWFPFWKCFYFFKLVKSKHFFYLQHFVYVWKRKILALGIPAFLQVLTKSKTKNVKKKTPPGSHSLLQPVLARTVCLPCQLIGLPQTSSCSFSSPHAILEMESYWVQEETDFKSVCHNQVFFKSLLLMISMMVKRGAKIKMPIALSLIMVFVSFCLFSYLRKWN